MQYALASSTRIFIVLFEHATYEIRMLLQIKLQHKAGRSRSGEAVDGLISVLD